MNQTLRQRERLAKIDLASRKARESAAILAMCFAGIVVLLIVATIWKVIH